MSVLAIITSIVALGVAIAALRQARTAFRFGHRPVIRVVAAFMPTMGVLGSASAAELELGAAILKNIGRGPGVNITAFDPENSTLIAGVDVVEPVRPGHDETNRSGRISLALTRPMVLHATYELYYQDTLGAWHLTRFRARPGKIECAFVGEVKTVPPEVEARATVAST